MTHTELITQLKSIGYPVAYHSFVVDEDNPPPTIPNITVFRINDDNISSDFKVHGKIKFYNIELYTNKKDLDAESNVEQVLKNIDPDYDTSESYIESEKVFQVLYQIKFYERG